MAGGWALSQATKSHSGAPSTGMSVVGPGCRVDVGENEGQERRTTGAFSARGRRALQPQSARSRGNDVTLRVERKHRNAPCI